MPDTGDLTYCIAARELTPSRDNYSANQYRWTHHYRSTQNHLLTMRPEIKYANCVVQKRWITSIVLTSEHRDEN